MREHRIGSPDSPAYKISSRISHDPRGKYSGSWRGSDIARDAPGLMLRVQTSELEWPQAQSWVKIRLKVNDFLFLACKVRVWDRLRQNFKLAFQDLWNATHRLSYSGAISGERSFLAT